MAQAIAETPILKGKFAAEFQEMMDNVKYASDEEIEDLKNTYNRIEAECTIE